MFTGVAGILANLDQHERAIDAALRAVAAQTAATLQAEAQANVPWQDQTGMARASLHTDVEAVGPVLRVWLSHGVPYGIYLETRDAGRLAILLPTIERHSPALQATLFARFAR